MKLVQDVIKAEGNYWDVKIATLIEAVDDGLTVLTFYPSLYVTVYKDGDEYIVSDLGKTHTMNVEFIRYITQAIYGRAILSTVEYTRNRRISEILDLEGNPIRVESISRTGNRQRIIINDTVFKYKNVDDLLGIINGIGSPDTKSALRKYNILKSMITIGDSEISDINSSLLPDWFTYSTTDIRHEDIDCFGDLRVTIKGIVYDTWDLQLSIGSFMSSGDKDDLILPLEVLDEMFESLVEKKLHPTVHSEYDNAMYLEAIHSASMQISRNQNRQEQLKHNVISGNKSLGLL